MVARTHDVRTDRLRANGNYVVLTNEKGENREYNVPEAFQFQWRASPLPSTT
jgi:hypothetical protein